MICQCVTPSINSEYLNDDKIGLLMDDIYKLGLTNLFIEIGLSVIKKFKVDTKFAHLDSTSFHLHGEYNNIEIAENDREADWKSIKKDQY